MALTRLAHQLVRAHFQERPKGIAIDATCGNGHDTQFLASLCFNKVIGFDVQASAIRNTQARLDEANISNVELHNCGHQDMQAYLDSALSCAMFNFGYLPSADKSITTVSDTSVYALKVALKNLQDEGFICLICYPGHPEGMLETQAIKSWLASIEQPWQVTQHLSKSPKPEAPVLYTISQVKASAS